MVNIDYVGIGLHTHTHMREYISKRCVCVCIFISRLALSGVAYCVSSPCTWRMRTNRRVWTDDNAPPPSLLKFFS